MTCIYDFTATSLTTDRGSTTPSNLAYFGYKSTRRMLKNPNPYKLSPAPRLPPSFVSLVGLYCTATDNKGLWDEAISVLSPDCNFRVRRKNGSGQLPIPFSV